MKDRLLSVLRLVVALALLLTLLHYIGLDQLKAVLLSIDPNFLLVLYGLLVLDTLLRAYNWGALLRVKGYHLPIQELVYNYVVGSFFGTFIPSSLGTDASRAFLIARRNSISARKSALAMVVLNLMGLLALCIVGFFSAFLLLHVFDDPTIVWVIVPVCLAYVVAFPVLMRGWVPNDKYLQLPQMGRLFHKIKELSAALGAFNERRTTMAGVLGIALVNQLLGIIIIYVILLPLDLQVPFHFVMAYVPVIILSRLIPFSIAGFGAEQGIFVFLFTRVGVTPAEAFVSSLLLSSANLSFALLGGILYTLSSVYTLFRKHNQSKTPV